MKHFKWIIASVLLGAFSSAAFAVGGDTRIHISYKTKVVRVKTTPGGGGTVVDYQIVLHPDGSVEDAYLTRGGNRGQTKAKLGSSKGVTYRVLNPTTIERKGNAGTHFHVLTVKVAGKDLRS
jgi:hypothetical protein